jgi:ACS family hexuronate transporter-like MFS transporter
MMSSVGLVIVVFSLAFFGQQSWSTLVMILPTDLIPRRAVGTVAGLVGLGGAMGGVVLGQTAGWLLDHGFSYTPVLLIAGSLHVLAFVVICVMIPRVRPIPFGPGGAVSR